MSRPAATTAQAQGQRRVDRIVLSFTALMTITMIGMLIDSPGLTMIPIPLMVALLTLLATLRGADELPERRVLIAQVAFHVVSLVLWVIAWLAVGDTTVTMAGLTTSVGVLVLIAWPFYTIASGLLYAYCAPHSDAVRHVLAETDDAS